MKTKYNNPPAFPISPALRVMDHTEKEVEIKGMTLLDYFAGQAIIGFMLNHNTATDCVRDDRKTAEWAYGVAEAMLKERERKLKND